jgi:hypothetical protein
MATKTFSELSREEEERVEAEEAEEEAASGEREPAAEPEPEPEAAPGTSAPPAQPMSEREAEKGAKRLEAEAERHGKRVREIMGDDFDALLPCPACFTPGYVLPPGTVEYEPEQQAALLALAGVEQGPALKQDPNAVACEACDGLGFLATGSRREGYTESACSKCGGQGWHAKELPGQAAPPPPPVYPQPAFPPPPSNGPGSPPQPFWDVASNSWKLP